MNEATAGEHDPGTGMAPTVARVLLGVALAYAGLAHLLWSRDTFQAQVPDCCLLYTSPSPRDS